MSAIFLCGCYELSGTYWHIDARCCCEGAYAYAAMCGTELAYAAAAFCTEFAAFSTELAYSGTLRYNAELAYGVQTFIGLAEFRPTGKQFVDMFTKQVRDLKFQPEPAESGAVAVIMIMIFT
eukprot:2601073-Rhodomonas_salina.3